MVRGVGRADVAESMLTALLATDHPKKKQLSRKGAKAQRFFNQ
jgi:hypothetical protein